MKLVHVRSLQLIDFPDSSIPTYAILSHTWETSSEVTYQEMISPTSNTIWKAGYAKIRKACEIALNDRYEYIWIDTCCIDKTSSAELSEAINSMYVWYAEAAKCYVYLSDLRRDSSLESMAKCRWFTRGWTLQELIAPKVVEFYDSAWQCMGTKDELAHPLADWTKIPSRVLNGNIRVESYSVAMRMSWAAKRRTTRIEDLAYCLLGIFNVNMPLLYGEGYKAFRRLQEEIIKRSNDLSIFAWELESEAESGVPRGRFTGLLAPTSACFAGTGTRDLSADSGFDFAITNKGLRVAGELELRILEIDAHPEVPSGLTYALCLDYAYAQYKPLAICLHKIGPGLFCRSGSVDIIRHVEKEMPTRYVTDCYIILDPPIQIKDTFHKARKEALRIAESPTWTLIQALPDNRWDVASQSFLAVPLGKDDSEIVVLMDLSGTIADDWINLTVLCDLRDTVPKAKLSKYEDCFYDTRLMRHQKYRERGVHWVDFESQAPELCRRPSWLRLNADGQAYDLLATFELLKSKGSQTSQWHLVITSELVTDPSGIAKIEAPKHEERGILRSIRSLLS